MDVLNYFDLEVLDAPVRSDLPEAFRKVWEHIAAAGPGWSSAERVAIAEESRRAETCALCRERRRAVSPNAVQGEHDRGDVLPEAAIEAIHRISTDPGRLTKSFFEQTLAAGVSDSQWVEFVGIVSSLKSIDSFYRALGLEVESLPQPNSDGATGYRPEGATLSGGWAPMIREKDLAESEEMLYDGAPKTGNVLRSMSLVPDEVRNLHRISSPMYLQMNEVGDFGASGNRAIDRMQIELLASRVSSLNECFYWTSAHALLLRASGRVQSDGVDIRVVADTDAAEDSGIEHARILTTFADAVVKGSDSDVTEAREAVSSTMGHEAMVDAAAVIANFQRMNRIADAMGIELDAPVRALSSDFRDSLGLSEFTSAANTKRTSGAMKVISKLIFPLALKFYRPPMSGK